MGTLITQVCSQSAPCWPPWHSTHAPPSSFHTQVELLIVPRHCHAVVHSQKYTFIRLIFIHSLKFSSSTVHPASLCDAWCTHPSPPLWLTVLLPPHSYMIIPCIQLPSPTRWPGLWFSQLWTTSATHSAYQYRGTQIFISQSLLSNLAVLIWTQTSKDVFQNLSYT